MGLKNWRNWIKEDPPRKRNAERDKFHLRLFVLLLFSVLLLWSLVRSDEDQSSYRTLQVWIFWASILTVSDVLVAELYKPMRFISALRSAFLSKKWSDYERNERIVRGLVFGLGVIGFLVVDMSFMREKEWLRLSPAVSLALFQIIRALVIRVGHWLKTGT
jgi:hypothetical protein